MEIARDVGFQEIINNLCSLWLHKHIVVCSGVCNSKVALYFVAEIANLI